MVKILVVTELIEEHETQLLRVGLKDLAQKSDEPVIADLSRAVVKKKTVLKNLLLLKKQCLSDQLSVFFLSAHPTLGDAKALEDLLTEIRKFTRIKEQLQNLKDQKSNLDLQLKDLHQDCKIAEQLQDQTTPLREQIQTGSKQIRDFLGEP